MARSALPPVALVVATTVVLLAAAPRGGEAITCSQVYGDLISCVGYLQGGPIKQQCCSGIKSLLAAARTTQDRRTACGCIKTAAAGLSGIDYGRVSQLPGQCGISVSYKISPNVDCSKIN
ncbi:Protease inhibitor/seed storage/LTP family [Musa troglodytarum]|uniref:Non-specific lipid-transfer protein n=1 Tax=Musa troglodytarum TaxID=320322 RepID=A0A9E7FK17_9LILI|nr:Protease inhibitor/seed storage/LTP family [Musa troglodytarum]